jgi:hypothetical protein
MAGLERIEYLPPHPFGAKSRHAAARHPEIMKIRTDFWTCVQIYALFSDQANVRVASDGRFAPSLALRPSGFGKCFFVNLRLHLRRA